MEQIMGKAAVTAKEILMNILQGTGTGLLYGLIISINRVTIQYNFIVIGAVALSVLLYFLLRTENPEKTAWRTIAFIFSEILFIALDFNRILPPGFRIEERLTAILGEKPGGLTGFWLGILWLGTVFIGFITAVIAAMVISNKKSKEKRTTEDEK